MREPDKSSKSTWRRVRAACTALGRDRGGSAFFYTTISLPVLVGFALLAIDGSRLMNLHSHLQHGADGLALAAAGELNHKDDSLERAKLAIQELINNNQRFGDAGPARIQCDSDEDCDVIGRFLTSLPPDDATSISAWIAEEPNRLVANLSDPNLDSNSRSSAARFVEITVKPQGLTTLMPAAFIGGSDTAAASATAVAGYTRGVCYFTPMMMCNPFEDNDPTTPTLYDVAAMPDFRRRMIEIRQVGPGASYFPGNFAFLRNEAMGNGANALRDALAQIDPGTCFVEDGVDTEPGQNMGPVSQGINVRFDIYDGPMSSSKNDPNFRPSMNVRKGFGYNGNNYCSATDRTDGSDYQGLPRDPEPPDTVIANGGRIYSGDWAFENYWAVNHAGVERPYHPAVGENDPVQWSDANPPSRYEVYRHEIDHGLLENESPGGERGEPVCYQGGTLTDDPDRRILHAAVINCGAEGPLNGAETDIPVYAFAKFFLIRPVDGSDSIDVEVVEVVAPPTAYEARDTVQLYR